MSDKAVPDDQVACEDADVLCKCVLFCARDVHKENEENYPPSTLHLLLAAFQRILCMNMVPFNLFDKSDLGFVICTISKLE